MEAKPSQYTDKQFFDSGLQSSEAEQICRNIMIILSNDGDEFKPFSWSWYKKKCSHRATDSEKEVLDLLVKGGWYYDNIGGKSMITGGCLEKVGSKYQVTEKLLDILEKFKS